MTGEKPNPILQLTDGDGERESAQPPRVASSNKRPARFGGVRKRRAVSTMSPGSQASHQLTFTIWSICNREPGRLLCQAAHASGSTLCMPHVPSVENTRIATIAHVRLWPLFGLHGTTIGCPRSRRRSHIKAAPAFLHTASTISVWNCSQPKWDHRRFTQSTRSRLFERASFTVLTHALLPS